MLPLTAFLTLISGLVLLGGVGVLVGMGDAEPSPKGIGGVVIGGLMGFISVAGLLNTWAARKSTVSVDGTGLWLYNGTAQNVIPWDTLAAVGLYWSTMGRGVKVYSIELCPSGPLDRDDAVLWPLVRDEAPLEPTLPRLRYRLPVTPGARGPLVEAIRAQVPHLWLGEAQRESGHMGVPDRKGHRERTRKTTVPST